MKYQKKMIKKKKIIIFIPSIESGGVEKNLFILINYLKKFYSELYVVTSSKIRFNKKIKFIFPQSNFWGNKNRLLKSIICSFLLLSYFKEKDVLIISFQSNIFSLIISKLKKWPILIRLNTSPQKYIKNFIKLNAYKFLYKLSDEIIVNSVEFKNNIKKLLNLNALVILNPILRYKYKKRKITFIKNFKGLKIINIGRLTDQKDQITLLKSIKLLLNKHKIDLKLVIIGKGKNYDLLKKFINENDLKKNIHLVGYKKDAQEYIKLFDLFILSSKYEGLPNTLIEAQMSGVPIISSDCHSGPKEILLNGKLGILYKTGDYFELYKKLLIFIKNKNKYQKKTVLAKKYLNRYDYKNNLKKYLNIINKYI